MKQENPKKIAIIGVPGSGKSTFAFKLSKILNLPVHHLDGHMFEPSGKKRNREEFLANQKAILDEAEWIIEGCSFSTFEMRFAKSEILIYFQFPRRICFWRIFKRLFNYKKEFSGLRMINLELLKYIWNFDKDKGDRIKELSHKYDKVDFHIFRSPKDVDRFFKEL